MIPNFPSRTDRGPVTVISFTPGTIDDVSSGLVGWLKIQIGDLVVDGITVRTTARAKFALSFPSRVDSAGRRHPFLRPTDDRARRALEAEVFAQLNLGMEGKP